VARRQAGRLYTIAGQNENAAAAGNGGPAARAALGDITELRMDAAGNLLIADEGRTDPDGATVVPPEVRVVAARDGTFYGQQMRAGYIYAIAGGGRLTANGVRATSASIAALGVDHDDAGNVITGAGPQLQVAAARTGRFYGQQMKAGDLYTVAGVPSRSLGDRGDGGPAVKAVIGARYVAVDGAGNLVFADADGTAGTIRAVAVRSGAFYGQQMKAGDIYRVGGSGETTADLGTLPGQPTGVASGRSGGLVIGYAADTRNGTSIGPDFIPARRGNYFGVSMRAGRLYHMPAAGAFGACPGAVAADRFGNVLIADQPRNRILVVPVKSGTFYGRRMAAGHAYPVAGDGKPGTSGDGGPALAADLDPYAVATDTGDDIFVVDNTHGRIRMVAARSGTGFGVPVKAGHIYTVAGGRAAPGGYEGPLANAVPATRTGMLAFGATVDTHGNLVLAADYRVRVVAARAGSFHGVAMKAGYIYTIAGPFPGAHDVAVDQHGNILVDDASANVIRLVAVQSGIFYGQPVIAGHGYVVAGRPHGPTGLGEGGSATGAWLDGPDAITVAPDGRLLIAEYDGQRIQAVTP
jgi:hypothetical protein